MTHHRGRTKEGRLVELFPHQVKAVKRLLSPAEEVVVLGGRGWGRSTVLVTAVELDKHLPGCPMREFIDLGEVCLCEA